jgi:hypothetical protein
VSGRRALLAAVVAGLAVTAIAAADVNDPKTRITKADQAHAAAAVLRLSDLGAAWTGGPEKPNSVKIPVCPSNQPHYNDLTITGHAESGFALDTQGVDIDTDVEVFKSKAQVSKLISRVITPALGGCLRYDLVNSIGRSATVGLMTKQPVPAVGDRVGLFRLSLSLKSGGKTVKVLSDYLFLSNGRIQFFVNIVAPANVEDELPALESRIAKTLALRGTG